MSNSHLRYRPEIDGLRALAVSAVVLFHAKLGILSGGYVGVDIFFVISGFLVTSLINKGLLENRFSLAEFWARRISRILPAMMVVILTTLMVSSFVDVPDEFRNVAESALAQSVSLSNFYFWRRSGYFHEMTETYPLLHMWSLSLEEQFYVIWPMLLILCGRRKPLTISITLLTWSVSFAASVYGSYFHPAFTFYLLPTRVWELLSGAIVALASSQAPKSRAVREAMALTAILAMVLPMVLLDSKSVFPGLNALSPVLGTSLYIFAHTNGSSWVGDQFSRPPIVLVGLISYSLYLWHWPVFVYTNAFLPEASAGIRIACIVGVVIVSYFSWKYIEIPLREAGKLRLPRWVFVNGCAALACLVLIVAGICLGEGIPQRLNAGELQHVKFDRMQTPPGSWWNIANSMSDAPRLGNPDNQSSPPPCFVLLGDSHALSAAMALDDLAQEFSIHGVLVASPATMPIPGFTGNELQDRKNHWKESMANAIVASHELQHIIICARWTAYLRPDALPRGGNVKDTEAESLEWLRDHFGRLLAQLRDKGKQVWVIGPIPEQTIDVGRLYFRRRRLRSSVRDALFYQPQATGIARQDFESQVGLIQECLQDVATENGAQYLDPSAVLFEDSDECLTVFDGLPLFYDDDHLSRQGADFVIRPLLAPILSEIKMGVGQPQGDSHYQKSRP